MNRFTGLIPTAMISLAAIVATGAPKTATAELSRAEAKAVQSIRANLNKTAALFQRGDFQTAAVGIRRVTAQIAELKPQPASELDQTLRPSIELLQRIHARVELQGVVLPPLRLDMTPAEMAAVAPAVAASSAPSQTQPTDAEKKATEKMAMEASEKAMTAEAMTSDNSNPGGQISFALQVAPILSENCNGCHLNTGNVRGGLNLSTFAGLLAGGNGGDAVDAGSGEDSMLVQRLRGEGGDLMPAGGRPPLSDDEIQLISTWIDQGAKLDIGRDNQPLAVMTKMAWASKAKPPEVTLRRREMADSDVKLVGVDNVISQTTEHFFLIGPVSQGTMDLVAQGAEAYAATAQKLVKAESGESLFHGKATVYVWPSRYDYSEFAKMVESRSVPRDWTAHWRSDGVVGYVSILASDRDDPKQIASRLISPILSLAVATRGDVPRWMAEGVGTVAAIRQIKDRDRIREIQAETAEAWAAMPSAKAFLDGKMSPEQTDRVGAAVASAMIDPSRRRNFDRMIKLLGQNQSFDEAFGQAYQTTIGNFVQGLQGR